MFRVVSAEIMVDLPNDSTQQEAEEAVRVALNSDARIAVVRVQRSDVLLER